MPRVVGDTQIELPSFGSLTGFGEALRALASATLCTQSGTPSPNLDSPASGARPPCSKAISELDQWWTLLLAIKSQLTSLLLKDASLTFKVPMAKPGL